MAKFIACEYHGTEDMKNEPVNFDLVQWFDGVSFSCEIHFYFQGDDTCKWSFENKETMELEYKRLIEILTK